MTEFEALIKELLVAKTEDGVKNILNRRLSYAEYNRLKNTPTTNPVW